MKFTLIAILLTNQLESDDHDEDEGMITEDEDAMRSFYCS